MESSLQTEWTANLLELSRLKKGQKLTIDYNGRLKVQDSGLFQGLWRAWGGDSRERVQKVLICTLSTQLTIFTNLAENEHLNVIRRKDMLSDAETNLYLTKCDDFTSQLLLMKNCTDGLDNYCETYGGSLNEVAVLVTKFRKSIEYGKEKVIELGQSESRIGLKENKRTANYVIRSQPVFYQGVCGSETKVSETKVGDTKVSETKVDTKLSDTKVGETKLIETKSSDKTNIDSKPTESKDVVPASGSLPIPVSIASSNSSSSVSSTSNSSTTSTSSSSSTSSTSSASSSSVTNTIIKHTEQPKITQEANSTSTCAAMTTSTSTTNSVVNAPSNSSSSRLAPLGGMQPVKILVKNDEKKQENTPSYAAIVRIAESALNPNNIPHPHNHIPNHNTLNNANHLPHYAPYSHFSHSRLV